MQASCGIDPLNPEAPKIALPTAPIAVGIGQGVQHRLMSGTVEAVACAPMAPGQLEHLLMTLMGRYATFHAGHWSLHSPLAN
jgi:hypothetical protein